LNKKRRGQLHELIQTKWIMSRARLLS